MGSTAEELLDVEFGVTLSRAEEILLWDLLLGSSEMLAWGSAYSTVSQGFGFRVLEVYHHPHPALPPP